MRQALNRERAQEQMGGIAGAEQLIGALKTSTNTTATSGIPASYVPPPK